MGPRRVGKTVLIHHTIQLLIKSGVPSRSIAYVSVDNPIYNECGLQELADLCSEASGTDLKRKQPPTCSSTKFNICDIGTASQDDGWIATKTFDSPPRGLRRRL